MHFKIFRPDLIKIYIFDHPLELLNFKFIFTKTLVIH